AATAGGSLVGIAKCEARAQFGGLEIHFGADQEQDRLGLDEDFDALILHHFVHRAGAFGIIHGVAHAGAAAIGDAYPDTQIFAFRLFHDLAQAHRSGFGKAYRLGTFAAGTESFGHLGIHQYMFNSSLASSLMRSGVQGGSKVMFTVTCPMPSTFSSAALTLPGISPATGQFGAVKVISTATSLLSATSTL